jgi:hypothetical protein
MCCEWPHSVVPDVYNQAITGGGELVGGVADRERFYCCRRGGNLRGSSGGLEKGGNRKVEFVVMKGYHDQVNIDLMIGYNGKNEGEQARAIKGWVSSRI